MQHMLKHALRRRSKGRKKRERVCECVCVGVCGCGCICVCFFVQVAALLWCVFGSVLKERSEL